MITTQQKIYRHLMVRYKQRYGKDKHGLNASVPAKVLCKITGLQERALRYAVSSMIARGYNIGSSNRNNYFLVFSLADEMEAVKPEEKRIRTIAKRIRMIRRNRMHKMSRKLV